MKSNIGRGLSLSILSWLLAYPIVLHIGSTAANATPIRLKLPNPPQRGIAGNRSAAASRDACPIVAQPLTALVPQYPSAQGNRVWGLTAMEHPTLLFYVPYAKTSIADISFTLQDESNPADTKIIYQNATIPPAQAPGVIRISLPKSSTALAANKPYHWFLKLNMDCRIGQRPIFVDGWIQRTEIESNMSAKIQSAAPTEKVAMYAANGMWYDALTTLANLRATKPQDPTLSNDWQNLLDSIELGSLASQPLNGEDRSSKRKIAADLIGTSAPTKQVQRLKGTGF